MPSIILCNIKTINLVIAENRTRAWWVKGTTATSVLCPLYIASLCCNADCQQPFPNLNWVLPQQIDSQMSLKSVIEVFSLPQLTPASKLFKMSPHSSNVTSADFESIHFFVGEKFSATFQTLPRVPSPDRHRPPRSPVPSCRRGAGR